VIGSNLTLTGGNCIGGRPGCPKDGLRLGSNITLGANAVVLGPVSIGDGVTVGAGAVVVRNAAPGETLVGVPAVAVGASGDQATVSAVDASVAAATR